MATNTTKDQNGSEAVDEFAREHPALVKIGRIGWAAKGVVYTLMGILALTIAANTNGSSDDSGAEASQSGAVATIAEQPAGALLLVAIALGLLLYMIWRLTTVLLPADNDAHAWLKRGGYLISTATYLALAWSALSFARQPGSSEGNQDAKVERFTRWVLEATGGRYLMFAVGAGVVAAGGYFLYKGYAANFMSNIRPGSVGPVSSDTLELLGRIGWVGRGLMMALIGYFLAQSAVTFDPDDAKGLDGALRSVAGSTAGTILITIVALGLAVYGVFCILSTPRRILNGAD